MVLLGGNVVREDVFDENLDERLAPGLGTTFLGEEHPIYTDPERFFSITLVTGQMADILENISRVLRGEEAARVILLSAFFGGGKTHTLIALYHALRSPQLLLKAVGEDELVQKKLRSVAERLGGLPVDLVVVDGNISKLAPHPLSPLNVGSYSVRTLWGYLAHALGSYSALRDYDEKLVVPEVDKLVSLFSGRRVVILVDEIAAYIKSLYTSADQSLRNYASAVSTFLERLANAAAISKNVVLVVSLPLAASGGEVREVEKTYQPIRDLLDSVVKALSRISSKYVEPVTPRNIPALLKTRLFAQVDKNKAVEVARALAADLGDNKEVFDQGLARNVVSQVVEAYPFHPLYISILYDILDKHERLQKTRDLLRVTRAVLRAVAKSGEEYELVMPWHIDLSDEKLGGYLLQGYEGFRIVVQTDVLERARNYEKPFLAEAIAKALLARTYVYGGLLTPRTDVFPTPYELAVMVYEPYVFKSRGYLPKDVIDAVVWVKENLVYVLEDETSGRLWFTQIITPVKYVEEEARRIVEEPVDEIVDVARRVFATPIEAAGKRGRRAERPLIFDVELSRVSYNCDKLDYDSPRYILYACLNVPEDEAKRRSLMEEVVYYTKSGGTRRFANTVYVVHPRSKSDIPVDLARRRVACKRVEEMGVVDRLAEGYGKDRDLVAEILKNKLKRYCDTVYANLLANVLAAMRVVSYPVHEEGKNTVAEVVIEPSDTVVKGVEQALSRIQPRKIVEDLDFPTLSYHLKGLGIDLANMEGPKRVRDVVDFFYSNPLLPAVPEEAVKKALAEGVKTLDIGLACGDKVYFKRVERCKSEEECTGFTMAEGGDVEVKSDDCQILPWRHALVEQMKSLKKAVEISGGVTRVRQYLVKLGPELKDVEEVLANLDKYDIEVLRMAPLLELEREAKVVLRPENPALVREPLIVRPGEEVEASFTLERVGPFEAEMILSANMGAVEPEKVVVGEGRPRESIKWRFKTPGEGGRYEVVVKALGADMRELSSVKFVVEVKTEERCRRGLPQPGTLVEELRVEVGQLNLKPLQILAEKFRQFKVIDGKFEISLKGEESESKISLSFENINIGDAFKIIRSIASAMLIGETSIHASLRLRSAKPVPMPSLQEQEARELERAVAEVCVG